jgi:HEPN domain-containing protein
MNDAARSFFVIAEEELSAARRLAPTHPRQAAFYVQQTAEKLLKALLTAEGVGFPYDHNLDRLSGLLPESNELKVYFRPFARFSAWATSHRYPTPHGGAPPPIPEIGDLLQALDDLHSLKLEVDVWLRERRPHIPR